jgi:peptidyl-prolyl cis-trans isomerase B (cyclophilin B)
MHLTLAVALILPVILAGCGASGPAGSGSASPRAGAPSTPAAGTAGSTTSRPEAVDRELNAAEISAYARLLAMADAREQDTVAIDAGLSSGNLALRRAAALSVGQVDARSRASVLRGLLDDTDVQLAANAAHALGLLRDEQSLPALVSALSGRLEVAREAAWAITEIAADSANDLSAVDALATALGNPALAAEVRASLVLGSGKVRRLDYERHLIPLLSSPDTGVAGNAAYVVGRARVQGATTSILPLARSASAATRAHVARALATPLVSDEQRPAALRALEFLSIDADARVRTNAIAAIAGYGEGARLAFVNAVRDRDPGVRLVAAQNLSRVMNRDLARWAWLWDSDTTFAYRRIVLEQSLRTGVEMPYARAWAGSPDWDERAALAEVAGAFTNHARGAQLVLPLLADSNASVRRSAVVMIGARLDSMPQHRAAIRRSVADANSRVRAAALSALADRPIPGDNSTAASRTELTLALDAHERAASDSTAEARIAALRLVEQIWRRDSLAFDAPVRARVAALQPPASAAERRAGRAIPLLAHWPAPDSVASGRPVLPAIAWYEDVVRTLVVPALNGTSPRAEIVTNRGTIVLELFAADAPLTVHSFMTLARRGFYNGSLFHRVVPNFVIQGGTAGNGGGGPGYSLRDELAPRRHTRGALSMAHSGPDTGGSQFFITHSAQPHLDGLHTVFGRVVEGMDVVDAIIQGDRMEAVRIR